MPCTSSPYATLSMTRLCGNRPKCWKTIDIFDRRNLRSAAGSIVMRSTPSMCTVPDVALDRAARDSG